jgi:PAS domain S-box-containing protein
MPQLPSIVVVDDATDVRQLVKTHLRLSERLDVVGEGSDGDDAVDLARLHRPDLMLLDVSMPRRDGLSALPLVREASPGTRVVMFSGFDEEGLADHARDLGASDFVQKSAPLDELVDRLVAVARGEEHGPTTLPDPAADLHPLLADHLERFREIFEDAAIGMATMTLDGRVVRANRHLAALLGADPSALVGRAYADLVEQADELGAHIDSLREGGAAVELEHGLVRPGSSRWVRSTLSAVLDAAGRPLYFFLQVQDISDQRAAEAELHQTEQRFKMLVETVQDYAIFMLDPQGHIASWNAGAARTKGYTADEIIGQHFRVFYPLDKREERHPEHELELAERDGRYEEEGWRLRKDGSRFWAHVTITAVRDGTGRLVGFAKVTRDATERHQLLERLRVSAEEQAQFLAVTAHELRSPIGVLAGSADTLTRFHDRLTPEERDELADGMRRSAEQLRRLLGDLLTVSRADAGTLRLRPQTARVDDLLRDVARAARLARPDAEIVLDVDPGLAVSVDPGRFGQMVENLLGNAVVHGEPPIHVRARAADDHVEIAVRDAGQGVLSEIREHLFERFGTTGGTGLGLYIVRELAHAHGGSASYRDEDAAFLLQLPRVDVDGEA